MPDSPNITCEQNATILQVNDVLAAADFYTTKLGFRLGFTWGDPPDFVGLNLGNVQLFLAKGIPNPDGCVVCFVIGRADEMYETGPGADALFEFHRTNGVEIVEPIGERQYDMRDYTVRDLHGYYLRFGHRLPQIGPPLRIERVEVPARLEKRLAALLLDLAEHKRMTVSSCLEEILLHTCEPHGDGVASPHTKATLKHIAELKLKHGIGYDCHASYRFVEGK